MAEIGIAFQTDQPPGRYGELAAAAEAHGFDVVSVFADLLDQPPLPALLEMARATSRVRLGAACLNPYTQHPYEIAGGLAALDAASGGRAYLGLARGAWLEAIGIEQRRPLDHLRDTAAIVRALLSGDERGYAGAAYRLAPGIRLRYPLPSRVPPLLLGTWGARGAALAGQIADEVKVGGSANPAVVPLIRGRVAVGTLAAGRPPDAVRVVLGAVTVVSEDGQAARQRARTEVARYLAVVADLDPTAELPDGFAGGAQAQRNRVDDSRAHHHRGPADGVHPAEPGDGCGRVLRSRPAAVREVRLRLLRAVRRLSARPAECVPDQDALGRTGPGMDPICPRRRSASTNAPSATTAPVAT
jgi:5,10-methylenetetrahydromethanopterin reductase